jgi:hypothetical protein
MEERLDAAIDRAVKRLVQAKAMKQMLASPLSTANSTAKLSSPRGFQPRTGPNHSLQHQTTRRGVGPRARSLVLTERPARPLLEPWRLSENIFLVIAGFTRIALIACRF